MSDWSAPLSCGNHSFPLLERRAAWQLIRAIGFTNADVVVVGDSTQLSPESVRADVGRAARELRSELEDSGLAPADLFVIPSSDFTQFAPNHPDRASRAGSMALFEDMLDLACRLEVPGITVLPGVQWDDASDPEGDLARSAEELQRRAEMAAACGIRLSFEAHLGSVAATPHRAAQLLDRAPSVELTLDYSHFVAQGYDPDQVHGLIPRSRHVQVRGSKEGQLQCPLRESTIRHGDIARRLHEAGYTDYLTVEYVWSQWAGMDECDIVSETVLLRRELNELMSP